MRLIIGSVLVFSLVVLFLFALFPADISIMRMIEVQAADSAVQNKIGNLQNWKSWNELLNNAALKPSILQLPDSGSENYLRVNGTQIRRVGDSRDSICTVWQYGKKSFTLNYRLTSMNNKVLVVWTLAFHVKWYPWDKLASMLYDKQLGPAMEQSLNTLRQELETQNR